MTTPLDHVLLHVSDVLATDSRVQELGLIVTAEHTGHAPGGPDAAGVTGASATVAVAGNVSTPERKRHVAEVTREVLAQHGWQVTVVDRTVVTTARPTHHRVEDL
jgi:hypothetical protein